MGAAWCGKPLPEPEAAIGARAPAAYPGQGVETLLSLANQGRGDYLSALANSAVHGRLHTQESSAADSQQTASASVGPTSPECRSVTPLTEPREAEEPAGAKEVVPVLRLRRLPGQGLNALVIASAPQEVGYGLGLLQRCGAPAPAEEVPAAPRQPPTPTPASRPQEDSMRVSPVTTPTPISRPAAPTDPLSPPAVVPPPRAAAAPAATEGTQVKAGVTDVSVSVAQSSLQQKRTHFDVAFSNDGRPQPKVSRYYSDFESLRSRLTATHGAISQPFPGKTLTKCTGKALDHRAQLLDQWLRSATGTYPSAPLVKEFLGLGESEWVCDPKSRSYSRTSASVPTPSPSGTDRERSLPPLPQEAEKP
eukprot:TRINITY_DN12780_c0_g1_i1.p1 TRINITY_DN12780_c0_g1~~TRINITY_DN12780_c0_g1_i1.p1  ORF type:complete len:364 (+),score=91.65 TRINITY_DN12780_c0_g1_i1:104-1195(+)